MKKSEQKIKELLSQLLSQKYAVVVTQNKKTSATQNFIKIEGKIPNLFHDGFWKTKPVASEKVSWGVHYEKSKRGGLHRLWAGQWLEPKKAKDRWIFRLSNVVGPYETTRTFADLFGANAQPTFIYLKRNISSNRLKTIDSTSKLLKTGLAELSDLLMEIPSEGADISVLAKRRLGHGALKKAVHRLFGDQCCITKANTRSLLICSHIKPWADCSGVDKVRPDNILLLAANWDAAFDIGLIGFNDDGSVVVSDCFKTTDAHHLGLNLTQRLPQEFLTSQRKKFLKYHRRYRMLDENGVRLKI